MDIVVCPECDSGNVDYSLGGVFDTSFLKCYDCGYDTRHGPIRPSWDQYFITIAFKVAERSTCDRAHVGAVLVRDKRIVSTGFNGSPSGLPHCDDEGHLIIDGHCLRTIHAEVNAIIQAALHGIGTKDTTCYLTHFPCYNCSKMLINAGIGKVVYSSDYGDSEMAAELLTDAGVDIIKVEK